MKFKHYLTINAKVLLSYVASQAICNIMLYFCFLILTGNVWGNTFCTLVFTGFCMVSLYSVAYKTGERDVKSYSTNKAYYLKGLVMCIMLLIVSAIFFCFYITRFNFGYTIGVVTAIDAGFEAWCCNLKFALRASGVWQIIAYIAVFAVPLISTVVGYIAGMHRYELGYKFFSKLVYKKK